MRTEGVVAMGPAAGDQDPRDRATWKLLRTWVTVVLQWYW